MSDKERYEHAMYYTGPRNKKDSLEPIYVIAGARLSLSRLVWTFDLLGIILFGDLKFGNLEFRAPLVSMFFIHSIKHSVLAMPQNLDKSCRCLINHEERVFRFPRVQEAASTWCWCEASGLHGRSGMHYNKLCIIHFWLIFSLIGLRQNCPIGQGSSYYRSLKMTDCDSFEAILRATR